MNIRIKPLVGAVIALGFPSLLWAANNSSSDQAFNTQMQQLQAQTQALQQQLAAVQQQLVSLQQQQTGKASVKASRTPSKPKVVQKQAVIEAHPATPPAAIEAVHASEVVQAAPSAANSPKRSNNVTAYEQNVGPAELAGHDGKVPFGEHSLANLGGFAVITSPYLHPNTAYDGGDLIVNYSSINKDASILLQRQNFQHSMASFGYGMPESGSLLEVSGKIEGQAYSIDEFGGNNETAVNLTSAQIDFQALVNRWFTGFMSFAYDDSPNSSGNSVDNSNLYLDNGFFTFGDLDKTPWRVTVGQLYVPFGLYNSFLVSDPLNKSMFRTKARPILLGYGVPGTPGFSGALFAFNGDTREGTIIPGDTSRSTNDQINQYGADANYIFNLGEVKTKIGASYIRNVADSLGMQSTGGSVFGGFDTNTGSQVLAHYVPGADLRAQFSFSNYILIGEYTTATRSFDAANLSFNGHGADPSDYHVEGVYSFDIYGKPTTFALGYDHSYQALGLNIPEQQIAAAINVAFWRNTLFSLELRHQGNYNSSDYASGNLSPIFYPAGSSSNAITAQFDIYF